MLKVINLFAGPGAGKSTTAAGLFHKMKLAGYKVELVTEFAKELVWDDSLSVLNDQLYLVAEQHKRINRLKNHEIDYVVTDSPILMNLAYCPEAYFKNFKPLVQEIYSSFNNINVLIKRVKPYIKLGRTQTEGQAKSLDDKIKLMLQECNQVFYQVEGDEVAPDKVLQIIQGKL